MNTTDTRRLQRIETALRKLGADQLAAVRQAVAARESEVEGALVIHQRAQAVTACPHCGGRVIRWGSAKGVPRFKCRNDAKSPDGQPVCGRSFNALTGTPLARLQKADLRLVQVEAEHLPADLARGHRHRKTDIALTNHDNLAACTRPPTTRLVHFSP